MYEVLRRRNGGYESSQIDREHFYVLRYLTLLSKFIELLYIVWVHWLGVWGAMFVLLFYVNVFGMHLQSCLSSQPLMSYPPHGVVYLPSVSTLLTGLLFPCGE